MTDDDTHVHKYFLFQVKADFEPYKGAYDSLPIDPTTPRTGKLADNLYTRVEYGILSCNCGAVIKTKVKNELAK